MKKYLIPALMTLGLVVSVAHGVSAQTANASASASTSTASAKLSAVIAKSDTAITARITSLNKLSANIAKFKHLTDTQRASFTSTIQTSIDAMNTLKAKIDADTDLTTAKTDYASITKDYRIYLVVVPSTADVAATDNAMANIATYQTTLGTLQTRITAAQTAGKDVTAVQASYNDANAKLTDAQTQGQALIAALTGLKPDMGDKTVQASNKTQVAAAKAARKALLADLAAARKDIASIRTGLKTLKA